MGADKWTLTHPQLTPTTTLAAAVAAAAAVATAAAALAALAVDSHGGTAHWHATIASTTNCLTHSYYDDENDKDGLSM